jgi:hypothetical protein
VSVPLKIAFRQKVALLLVVSLSSLVIIAAIIRLLKVTQFNVSPDRTCKSPFTTRQNEVALLIMVGDFADITTWSAVEIDTGLFCASATTIKPLIRNWMPVFFSSSHSVSDANQYQHHQRNTNHTARQTDPKSQTGHTAFELKYQFHQASGERAIGWSNTFWRGNDGGELAHVEDNDSVRAMLGDMRGDCGIMKTVSISINHDREDQDEAQSGREEIHDRSVGFESV